MRLHLPCQCVLLLYCLMLSWTCAAADDDAVEIDLDRLFEEEDSAGIQLLDEDGSTLIDLGSSLVTARRSLLEQLSDYSAVTVLDAARFGNSHSLANILERIPGIDVRNLGGSGQLSTVSMRGASGGQVLVLLDGQPLSPQQASDLSLVAPGSLASIEILRGPQALQFGPGALGGVVNLVSLAPDASEPDLPSYSASGLTFKEFFHELAMAEHNPDDSTRGQIMSYAALAGSHGLVGLELDLADDDAVWSFIGRSAQNDYSYRRADGSSSLRRNADSSQHSVTGTWRQAEISYRIGFSDLSRGIPGSAEFPALSARLDRQSLWLQSSTADRRSALSAQFTHVRDPHPYLNRGKIDNTDLLLHGEHEVRRTDWLLRPRLDYADGSSVNDRLRAGLDYSGWQDWDHGRWSHSLSWGLIASSDQGLDPLAGLALRREFGDAADAYASLSRAVRHPSFDELYLSDSGSLRGNPDLATETVDSLELGYRRSFPSARLELAAFYSSYRDSIIFAPVSAYLVEARNTGEAQVAGAEAMLDWQLDDSLWWTSSTTWLPLAEYENGIPLTGRSSLHAVSGLQYTQADWSIGASVDHTSSIPADLFGNLRTAARSTANLEFGLGPDDNRFELSLHNLFNTAARDAWNYPLPGRELSLTWSSTL